MADFYSQGFYDEKIMKALQEIADTPVYNKFMFYQHSADVLENAEKKKKSIDK